MTEQEAMWVLKDFEKQVTAKADGAYQSTIGKMACDMAISALEEIQQYRAFGTVEELREARERQVPKKPIRNDLCTCPSCGTHNEVIKKRRNTVNNDIVHCWHCGQAIEVNRLE